MRHEIKCLAAAIIAISGLTACEKEGTFLTGEGEGQLDCSTLSIDYINSGRQTRGAGVSVDDFTVDFINSEGTSVKSYVYSQMPEVVALPVGDYTIKASYGDNPIAEWESPYYLGSTASAFSIKAGKITTDIDPVECELSNIRISVNIDDLGLGIVGDDAKVTVKVGNEGSLDFTKDTNDKSGYFRYITNSETIAAVFSGTVDGEYVDGITRTYSNAAEGNYYIINFTISRPNEIEDGSIQIGSDTEEGVYVDANIAIRDENIEIDLDDPNGNEGEFQDWRPMEGNESNPGANDPNEKPDDPKEDPAPVAKGPQIIMTTDDLVLNQCGEAYAKDEENGVAGTKVSFKVVSETGITDFLINIDSTTLTPDELEGVGLGADIDLINPGDFEDSLIGLGFAVGNSVKDQLEVEFDISDFVGLLDALGEGEHKFNLTVTDSTGTTKGIVWFKNIKKK